MQTVYYQGFFADIKQVTFFFGAENVFTAWLICRGNRKCILNGKHFFWGVVLFDWLLTKQVTPVNTQFLLSHEANIRKKV